MPTITDIRFDNTTYSQIPDSVLILYQLNGVALVIPLPNANLFTFIKSFDAILDCQNHINTHLNKTFTLFTYGENIETWLWNHNVVPDHLDEITIFCQTDDQREYLKRWARRYTQKVKEIIVCDELDRNLLIFGMNYIKNLYKYFQQDQSILNLLKEDYKKIVSALMVCLENDIKKPDDCIATGVQTA